MNVNSQFRGWTIPGEIPPGALTNTVIGPGETLDALGGHFRIFQLENGHRFSTDDILTAWYGSTWAPSVRAALDLGSGIGTVAMLAAWRLAGARFVTVEAQSESIRLARKSAEWNGLLNRFDIRRGDFRDRSVFQPDERFDLVLGSPPYFSVGSGIEGDHPQKAACRFELRGNIADYCQVAAAHLAQGGWFACVFPITPAEQHDRIRAAAQQNGLTIIRWRPVVLREPEPPLLGLFAMILSRDLPDWMRDRSWEEPPLTIRRADGTIHAEYSAVKLSFGFPP
ncbi:MAG TPA: methyltransferase domain-containing protein [Verrucomicrobiae bacterium]|nr:methyltransferase domain-containing protein [Verrucomicrobiae bacterium]